MSRLRTSDAQEVPLWHLSPVHDQAVNFRRTLALTQARPFHQELLEEERLRAGRSGPIQRRGGHRGPP